MDTWQIDVLRAWEAIRQERKEALLAGRKAAKKARKEAGRVKEAARKASRDARRDARRDKRARLIVEAEGLTTRDLLGAAEAEKATVHWARRAVEGNLKLRGPRAWALKAALGRPMAARSDNELVAWTIQADRAARTQGRCCRVSDQYYDHEDVFACWHRTEKGRQEHIQEARLLGVPLGGGILPSCSWRAETLQWVGALGRLTNWGIPMSDLIGIAHGLVVYTKSGEVAQGIREWLTPERVGDLLRVARRFMAGKERYGRVPVGGLPPSVLLKLTRVASWLTDEVLRDEHREVYMATGFDKDLFWSEVARVHAQGRTKTLRRAATGQQVRYLYPGGYSKKVADLLRGVSQEERWHLLRETKWGAYREALKAIKAEAESEELAEGLALRAVSVFGNETSRWLRLAGQGSRALHDHTEWLPLVRPSRLKGLAAVLFKYRGGNQQDLRTLAAGWAKLDEEEKGLPSLKQLVLAVRGKVYMGATGVLKPFGTECARWGASQAQFDQWSIQWAESHKIPHAFPHLVDKVWEHEGMRGYFIPRHDPRGLFLGMHTNCCQHPAGEGKTCAWHGQESPHGGFFVWENSKGVQAQAWVWTTKGGDTCFDNVECMSYDSGLRTKVVTILNSVAKELGGVVTLGLGYDKGFGSTYTRCTTEQVLHPADYSGYRDSGQQVLVAQSAKRVAKPLPGVYTRMANEGDLPSLEAIADICFPEGMQFVSMGSHVVVLVRDGEVVGYASLQPSTRDVNDIAVHPRARRHIMPLLESMLEVIRAHGGEWRADCRVATSLPMMKGMEKRGLLKILSVGDPYAWGADSMVRVRFQATD